MRKILFVFFGVMVLIVSAGCVSHSTTRRVNALYDKVNQIDQRLTKIEETLGELEAELKEIQTPPGADLVTLKERFDQLNQSFVILSRELAKVQEKVGITPSGVTAPTQK